MKKTIVGTVGYRIILIFLKKLEVKQKKEVIFKKF